MTEDQARFVNRLRWDAYRAYRERTSTVMLDIDDEPAIVQGCDRVRRAEENARRLAQINFPPIQAIVSGADLLRSLWLEEHKFPLGWDERWSKI